MKGNIRIKEKEKSRKAKDERPKAEWKNGGMEGWKAGRLEDWKAGRETEWKSGRLEGRNRKVVRVEGWKSGRKKNGRMEGKGMEGWKSGRMEGNSRKYGVWSREKEREQGQEMEELIDLAYERFYRKLEMLWKNFDNKTICMNGDLFLRFDNCLL